MTSTPPPLPDCLTCPACLALITTERTVGKPDSLQVRCPKCRESSELGSWRGPEIGASVVSPPEETATPSLDPNTIGDVPEPRHPIPRTAYWLAAFFIGGGLLLWASPLLAGYAVLGGLAATAAVIALRGRLKRYRRVIAGGAFVLSVLLYGYYDTRTHRWSSGEVDYVDTYTRWGNEHTYRELSIMNDEFWVTREGPIAGTGKPHGEWKTVVLLPEYERETRFYWYGQEISEGEWHLRNK